MRDIDRLSFIRVDDGEPSGGMFWLHYIGGPLDGARILSPRPYDRMIEPDGSIYEAEHEGPACIEPLGSKEFLIRLYYAERAQQ